MEMWKIENLKDIERFMQLKKANGQSDQTIRHQTMVLMQLSNSMRKTFKEAAEKDMIDFVLYKKERCADSTVATFILVIKGFYKFLYNMKKHEYPEQVVNLNGNNAKLKMPMQIEDIIKKQDIAVLIKSCRYYRDEAIVTTLFESGCRIGEFIGMNVEHLVRDKHGFILAVSGKTGQRRIRLIESAPFIERWLEVHPLRDKEGSKPLWVTLRPVEEVKGKEGPLEYRRIKINTAQCLVKGLKKRSGIKKRLNCHSFRHSRATELSKSFSDAKMRIFFGWTKTSKMPGVYSHLSGADIDEDILRLAGEEIEVEPSPLRSNVCPRCKTKNPATNMFCGLCGRPLDEKKALDQELDAQIELRDLNEKYVVAVEGIEGMMDEIQKLRNDITDIKSQKR